MMHYRTFVGNYRQIIKYERLNVCELLEKDFRSPSTPMEYIFNGIDSGAQLSTKMSVQGEN